MCLISIVSAIETVGDISGIAKGGAGREATYKELAGGTYADGIGSAIAGVFGGLPNTSFSQNVGLISMTGVMSRSVVTLSALFLIACGLIPKVGAVVAAMPISVLGRRRHPDVRHGAVRRCQHAVQRQLVSAQHDDPGNIHVSWPWPPAGTKINAASA